MKKILLACMIVAMSAMNLSAQEYMRIINVNGTTQAISVDAIDSILFFTQTPAPEMPVPVVTAVHEGELCYVNTLFTFAVELDNPNNLPTTFHWIFPEGITRANGSEILEFTGTAAELGKVKFTKAGAQIVALEATLGSKPLAEVRTRIHVAVKESAPTLYFAIQGGNLMALKLTPDLTADNAKAYDLGIQAGHHAFNLLCDESHLYILDAGRQFGYTNDVYGTLGDGKISALAYGGNKVETVITNEGGHAFQDPYYGYMEDGMLYYADRNTGVICLPATSRNERYYSYNFPYFFQNATLSYYGQGLFYGAIGGCFGKVESTWYWCKFYNGTGIFRFETSDILKDPINQATGTPPAAGVALSGMFPKSFVYNKKTQEFFFTIFDAGYNGFYRCANIAELDAIGRKSDLDKHKVLHTSGGMLECNTTSASTIYEGGGTEPVGICQLALDEATGCVYFGYRSSPTSSVPAGLMRYNPATGKVETVIEGLQIYGVTINNTPTRLF